MGLFNSYTKEGKGVEKNAMRPIRPLYFFELFWRKFWNLIQMNLLYAVITLPIWILVALFVFNDQTLNNFSLEFTGGFLFWLAIVFIALSWLIGPATAGMTYVLKCFATETPVFRFSDFFEQFRKNFKQSTVMSIINGVFLLSFSLTLTQGNTLLFGNSDLTLSSMRLPLLIINLILILVNYYAYSIMVMFQLKLSDLIKNAFIFALAKLPLNLLILALVCVICYFSYYYLFIGFLLTIIILYAFCGFLVVFSVYPTLEKHMLIPAQKLEKIDDNKNEKENFENDSEKI